MITNQCQSRLRENYSICSSGNCSQLTVENAHVIAEKDGVLVISCNEGYSLTGPGKINCENGSLNGPFPSCVRGSKKVILF